MASARLEILIRARDQASRTIGRVRGATQKLGQAMNRLALLGGAALVGLGVASIKLAADFEAAMSKSIAIMGDVSDAMREKMARAARDVALVTTFSAEQAAESYFFLASAAHAAHTHLYQSIYPRHLRGSAHRAAGTLGDAVYLMTSQYERQLGLP